MGPLLRWFDAQSPGAVTSVALVLLLLISAVDYLTPPEITTSVFYLGPLGIAAWFAGRASGLLIALLASGAWVAKDIAFRGVLDAERCTFAGRSGWPARIR